MSNCQQQLIDPKNTCACPPAVDEISFGLPCLERPDFFSGQMLTDQDLDALVDWTRGRLRLSRLREGWGVVCGLQVESDTSVPHRPQLLVGAGYAVDCSGEDVVACNPLPPLPLWKYCGGGRPSAISNETARSTSLSECAQIRSEVTDEERRFPDSFFALDLFVSYSQDAKRPDTAAGHANRGDLRCRPTRWEESAKLTLRPAAQRSDDDDRLLEEFNRCLEVIDAFQTFLAALPVPPARDFVDAPKSPADQKAGAQRDVAGPQDVEDEERGEAIRQWLIHWMDYGKAKGTQSGRTWYGRPLRRRPLIRLLVAEEASAFALCRPKIQAQILKELVTDARLQLVQGTRSFGEREGVQLARIWMRDMADGHCCSLVAIETEPPFRDEFSSQNDGCTGNVPFGPLYGKKACETAEFLTRQGIEVSLRPLTLNTDGNLLTNLRRQLKISDMCLQKPTFAHSGETCVRLRTGYTLLFDRLTERVIGVSRGAAAPPIPVPVPRPPDAPAADQPETDPQGDDNDAADERPTEPGKDQSEHPNDDPATPVSGDEVRLSEEAARRELVSRLNGVSADGPSGKILGEMGITNVGQLQHFIAKHGEDAFKKACITTRDTLQIKPSHFTDKSVDWIIKSARNLDFNKT